MLSAMGYLARPAVEVMAQAEVIHHRPNLAVGKIRNGHCQLVPAFGPPHAISKGLVTLRIINIRVPVRIWYRQTLDSGPVDHVYDMHALKITHSDMEALRAPALTEWIVQLCIKDSE